MMLTVAVCAALGTGCADDSCDPGETVCFSRLRVAAGPLDAAIDQVDIEFCNGAECMSSRVSPGECADIEGLTFPYRLCFIDSEVLASYFIELDVGDTRPTNESVSIRVVNAADGSVLLEEEGVPDLSDPGCPGGSCPDRQLTYALP